MLWCGLSVLVALTTARPPPAWRALQHVSLARTLNLAGSPPCLDGLHKTGAGSEARWHLATVTADSASLIVTVQLDRNPDEPCCKLLFHDNRTGDRVGFMLLATAEPGESALRGMQIAAPLRGRGLSRLLLAVWARLCIEASIQPTTRVINKPLLSLSLTRLGFHPVGAGQRVSATPVKRLRDCRSASSGGIGSRTAIVHTSFVPADVSTVRASVDAALEDSSFRLARGLTSSQVRRALTLRVQDECTGT